MFYEKSIYEENIYMFMSKTKQQPHILDLLRKRRIRRCVLSPETPALLQVVIVTQTGYIRCICHEQELQIQKVIAALATTPGERIQLGIDLKEQSEHHHRRSLGRRPERIDGLAG